MIKLDTSDGFYQIGLNIDDIPKLGVVFPTLPGDEPLIGFPLVLPVGWMHSPPVFSTATENIADIANARLSSGWLPPSHPLDDLATSVSALPHEAYWGSKSMLLPEPYSACDPSLPIVGAPDAYVDVFVDDFVGLAQKHKQQVHCTLLEAVDEVLCPLSPTDPPTRQEPVSIKKLLEGDGSWSTIKLVLGWILDTESLTIRLPPHCAEHLWEILDKIPPTQHRSSIKKWHRVLGELCSMSLALPGLCNIFSTMQNALALKTGDHLALDKGVHHALEDFQWMQENISTRPTRIAEVVPLPPVAKGHHNASGLGAGGNWFPGPHLAPRSGFTSTQPLVWRHQWPDFISSWLVVADNLHGSTNSDLELAGGLLHLDALSQCFDIQERTVLSKGDNLSTTFWECRGSTSTNSPAAYLLRLFGMHQWFH
jgi:hypothetical protein